MQALAFEIAKICSPHCTFGDSVVVVVGLIVGAIVLAILLSF